MFVDRSVGMVVPPIEPVIFQSRHTVETFSLSGTGDGAALEVPFAGCGGVEEQPWFGGRIGFRRGLYWLRGAWTGSRRHSRWDGGATFRRVNRRPELRR